MRAAQRKRWPGHLQNFTGLEVEQFEELVEALRAEVGSGQGVDSIDPDDARSGAGAKRSWGSRTRRR